MRLDDAPIERPRRWDGPPDAIDPARARIEAGDIPAPTRPGPARPEESTPMGRRKGLRIADICTKVETDLAAPWRIAALARAAGMAPHHFQRQFAAATGETVAGYIRSRRLERAAHLLQETDARIIDVALDTGFQTHAALTRAFTAHFGCGPRAFRRDGLPEGDTSPRARPFLRVLPSRTRAAACDRVDVPAQILCHRRRRGVRGGRFFGDLTGVTRAFAALRDELAGRPATFATAMRAGPKGIDDPDATALYGALLPEPIDLEWSPERQALPAGTFAVFPHHGPAEGLPLTWNRCVRAGLGRLGLRFRPGWMYETYLTDRVDAPDGTLSALIYVPVQNSTIGTAEAGG
jgi:AraC-like DNA-binding protein